MKKETKYTEVKFETDFMGLSETPCLYGIKDNLGVLKVGAGCRMCRYCCSIDNKEKKVICSYS